MPFVRVNKLGKRFTPEYDPYGQLALAIQYQPGTYDFYTCLLYTPRLSLLF